MKISTNQMERFTTAWERSQLIDWLARMFPDYYYRWSPAERDAYLDNLVVQAQALGFIRHHHLQFLIGYELGHGQILTGKDHIGAVSPLQALLLQRDVDPEIRIEAAEHLLYGVPDYGS